MARFRRLGCMSYISFAVLGFVEPKGLALAAEGTNTQSESAMAANAAGSNSRVGETGSLSVAQGVAGSLARTASVPFVNGWFEEPVPPADPPVNAQRLNSGVCFANTVGGKFNAPYPADSIDIVYNPPYWQVKGTPGTGPEGIGITTFCDNYGNFLNPDGTPFVGTVTYNTTPFTVTAWNGGSISIPLMANASFCYLRGIHGNWTSTSDAVSVEKTSPTQWSLAIYSGRDAHKIEATAGCIKFNGISNAPVSAKFFSTNGSVTNTGIPSSGTGAALCALESVAGPFNATTSGAYVVDYNTGIWRVHASTAAWTQCLYYKL